MPGSRFGVVVLIALAALGLAQCRGGREQSPGQDGRGAASQARIAVESSGRTGRARAKAPGSENARAARDGGQKAEARSWLDDEPEGEPAVEPDRRPGAEKTGAAAPGGDRAPGAGQSPRRCAFLRQEATRIWPTPSPVAIEAAAGRFLAAGYSRAKEGEKVFVLGIAPGRLAEPLATLRLDNPHPGRRLAAPGLSVRDGVRALLAVTDGSGAVLAGEMLLDRATASPELGPVGGGADTRFQPAVAQLHGLSAVAWCTGSTPMHTRVAFLGPGNRVAAVHDVTPTGMGASAPAFVEGADPPLLLALDAHEGYSPLLRVPFSADGIPAEAEVVIPLNLIATPPQLAAARAAFGVFVAYTAVGNAATSAVGVLPIEPETEPVQALVPGTGYGRLQVDAAAGPRALLFAADAPIQQGAKDELEIRVRVVDEQGMGPALQVRGPDDRAEGAALARGTDGTVALAFSSPSGVYVHWLVCDDR